MLTYNLLNTLRFNMDYLCLQWMLVFLHQMDPNPACVLIIIFYLCSTFIKQLILIPSHNPLPHPFFELRSSSVYTINCGRFICDEWIQSNPSQRPHLNSDHHVWVLFSFLITSDTTEQWAPFNRGHNLGAGFDGVYRFDCMSKRQI